MKLNKIKKILVIVILSCLLFLILIPLWWAIVLSFDRTSTLALPDFSIFPHEFSFFNYQMAGKLLNLGQYYKNTIFITIVNTCVSVFTAIACGYAFAKGIFPGKKLWYILFLSVMMLPFEARMIPLYLQYKSWGLLNTYWPLILGNFAYVYGIFFARQNIATIPDSLRESALLDGASEWGIFFRIILPLSKPIISTLSILQIISNWNSYLWPLIVIRSSSKQLISVGVSLFNASQTDIYYGPRMAVAVISAVPLIILFLFLQKYIVQSIALSGVKQ